MLSVLVADHRKCTGCLLCEAVCSLYHAGQVNPLESRVRVIKWDETGVDVPVFCQHCEEPVCEQACITGAIKRDPATGLVTTDETRCVHCRMCIAACPFGGPNLNPEGKVVRCDLCGGNPVCARFCETGALKYERADVLALERKRQVAAALTEALNKVWTL